MNIEHERFPNESMQEGAHGTKTGLVNVVKKKESYSIAATWSGPDHP